MTEKEKMLAHQMYDANYNKELHDERIAAKELCWEYNQLRPSNEEGQRAVLKKLLGKTGENFYITAPFWCALFGALYLAIVAILPIIAGIIIKNTSLAVGGTSVIIVVGVALETVKSLEAQMLMRHYKGFLE